MVTPVSSRASSLDPDSGSPARLGPNQQATADAPPPSERLSNEQFGRRGSRERAHVLRNISSQALAASDARHPMPVKRAHGFAEEESVQEEKAKKQIKMFNLDNVNEAANNSSLQDTRAIPTTSQTIASYPYPSRGTAHFLVSSNPKTYDNPELKKVKIPVGDSVHKQYTLNNKDLNISYPDKPVSSDPVQSLEQKGSGGGHIIYARRNAKSPFYLKVSRYPLLKSVGEARIRILNAIAELIIDDPSMKDHFAVEILKDFNEKEVTYITPAVNGFALNEYFHEDSAEFPKLRAELPVDALEAKLKELKAAVKWLVDNGYIHGDIWEPNILFNRDTGKLVLVDFELARPVIDYTTDLNKELGDIDKIIESARYDV